MGLPWGPWKINKGKSYLNSLYFFLYLSLSFNNQIISIFVLSIFFIFVLCILFYLCILYPFLTLYYLSFSIFVFSIFFIFVLCILSYLCILFPFLSLYYLSFSIFVLSILFCLCYYLCFSIFVLSIFFFLLFFSLFIFSITGFHTVKPLIRNTSEEFIKCRLDNFSMSFILYYVNFSIC